MERPPVRLGTPQRSDVRPAWQHAFVAHGIRTVVPSVPAVTIDVDGDAESWIAYPYLHGRQWDGGTDDLAAAGALLGFLHAASRELSIDGFPRFAVGQRRTRLDRRGPRRRRRLRPEALAARGPVALLAQLADGASNDDHAQ